MIVLANVNEVSHALLRQEPFNRLLGDEVSVRAAQTSQQNDFAAYRCDNLRGR
jgi:hypothetical protein